MVIMDEIIIFQTTKYNGLFKMVLELINVFLIVVRNKNVYHSENSLKIIFSYINVKLIQKSI